MKKLLLLSYVILGSFIFAQNIKMDTLTGTNGIFKKFVPKEIVPNQNLHFNLKISFSGKDKKGKERSGEILMNTKFGYFGMLKKGVDFNPNSENFNLLVYSNSLKNYLFKNDKKGRKTVLSIPIDPEINKQEISIKKGTQPVKTFMANKLKGYPYYNEKTKKDVFYFSEENLSTKQKGGKLLMYAGLGFYELDGKTALCLMIEQPDFFYNIDKIEAVNLNLDTSKFKKNEEMEVMQKQLQEIMKKVKKN